MVYAASLTITYNMYVYVHIPSKTFKPSNHSATISCTVNSPNNGHFGTSVSVRYSGYVRYSGVDEPRMREITIASRVIYKLLWHEKRVTEWQGVTLEH